MVDCRWVLSCSTASLVLVPAFSHVQFCTLKHLIHSVPHLLTGSALISSFCFLQPWFLTWVCMQTTRSLFFIMWTPDHPHQNPHREFATSITAWVPPIPPESNILRVRLRDLPLLQSVGWWLCVLGVDTHSFKPVGLRHGQLYPSLGVSGNVWKHFGWSQLAFLASNDWRAEIALSILQCMGQRHTAWGSIALIVCSTEKKKTEFSPKGFLLGLLCLESCAFSLSSLLSPHLAGFEATQFLD